MRFKIPLNSNNNNKKYKGKQRRQIKLQTIEKEIFVSKTYMFLNQKVKRDFLIT